LGSVDHELNTSAFAVRVVASTGASLAACVSAGLSALSGPRHGGQTSLVEILFEESERFGARRTHCARAAEGYADNRRDRTALGQRSRSPVANQSASTDTE
jgi:citrate synthase